MKQGKSLVDIARKLDRMRAESRDYVAPVAKLEMTVENSTPTIQIADGNGGKHLVPNTWAHRQIATYADIPQQYYQRISQENPKLLADSVNHGFRKFQTENRMVRTIGSELRAFVSSKYRRLDNYDLMNAVMPELVEHGFQVESAEITNMRLYLKATTPKLQMEVSKGDVVQFGLTISGSDVGAGSVRVEPLIYRLVCLNGLILPQAIRKTHLGKDLADSDVYELLTDDTKNLTDQAFWFQVRDVVRASMNPKRFENEVEKLKAASQERITNFDIPEVVELAARTINISNETTKQNVVAYLANGADGAGLTKWGLVNAFTHAAQQDNVNYDDSIEIERAAGKLLTLPPRQWARISENHSMKTVKAIA